MGQHISRKPMIRYRFKDKMGCVFYQSFHTDREARLWFERNKYSCGLKELNNMGIIYPATTVVKDTYTPIIL